MIDGWVRVAGPLLLRPLRIDDLMQFEVYHELDNERLKFAFHLMHFPMLPLELQMLSLKQVGKPLEGLLQYLNRPNRLRLMMTLGTRAIRSAAAEDTRTAIIDAWTALEVYVDNVLSAKLQVVGISGSGSI